MRLGLATFLGPRKVKYKKHVIEVPKGLDDIRVNEFLSEYFLTIERKEKLKLI